MNRKVIGIVTVRRVKILSVLVFGVLPATAPIFGGTITQIIDTTGDGVGRPIQNVCDIAVDRFGNVFVAGFCRSGCSYDNAFKITPSGVITEIIDRTADASNILFIPRGIDVDGNVPWRDMRPIFLNSLVVRPI